MSVKPLPDAEQLLTALIAQMRPQSRRIPA